MNSFELSRRALLESALALPLVKSAKPMTEESPVGRLYTGLPGLDYASGGIGPGEVLCISGPPCTGKTLLSVDLATRISMRYGSEVLLYSGHKPSVYIAKKAALRGGIAIHFWDDGGVRRGGPAVYLLDSMTADVERALEIAVTLQGEAAKPGTALIMDGWSTLPAPSCRVEVIDGITSYPAERWPHTLLSRERLRRLRELTSMTRLPVVLGVTTASLMDDEALAASWDLESEIRRHADQWVKLHRPALYKGSAEVRPEERHAVELTGTSPRWWDTRFSKLRFDPRDLGFSTVA
jgi:hypothetical protein